MILWSTLYGFILFASVEAAADPATARRLRAELDRADALVAGGLPALRNMAR